EREEAVLETRVAAHRGIARGGVRARHLLRRAAHLEHEMAEPARVEDAGACRILRVARSRILRQVADLAAAIDPPAGRLALPREDLRQGRLAGAVAADEPDLVTLVDAEVHAGHEQARADPDLEIVHGEHSGTAFLREGVDKRGRWASPLV